MGQTGASVSPMSNAARNTYVREHITAALLQLLREKPLRAVSVSELCERAGRRDLDGHIELLGYVRPTWPVLEAADAVVKGKSLRPW